jgi:tetratricopeptide (TPR) repeat protein
MEGKKTGLILLLMFLSNVLFAQYDAVIYRAYTGDDMTPWKQVVDEMEATGNKPDAFRLELINYTYGYIGWCLGQDRNREAAKYMDVAESHLNYLENRNYHLSEIMAYRAAMVGFSIALAPYKAPFLGPRSIGYAENAVELNPENYLGILQQANIRYFTPPIFGGSKEEAMEKYLLSLKVYKKHNPNSIKDWNHLSIYTTIIMAYMELGEYDKAEKYSLEVLEIEPEFKWIRDDLYPEIKKKNSYE